MAVLIFRSFFSLRRHISKTAGPIFTKYSGKTAKWSTIEKLSFWFPNSFGVKFERVTLASDPALQNSEWRQNRFTYRKRKMSDFGDIISPPNAENRTKICQETVEILWSMWCEYKHGGAPLTTLPLDSVNRVVSVELIL